jgi:hypothetical protein
MPDVPTPLIRHQYPSLREEESRLLRHYLRETGIESVESLRTQVRVGQGELVPSLPPKWQRIARDLSRWKIDAVVDRPGHTELVELKSRGTHTAAGQLIGYSNWLRQSPAERSQFKLSIVAFRVHPDLIGGLRGTGIRVHVLPSADETTSSRS